MCDSQVIEEVRQDIETMDLTSESAANSKVNDSLGLTTTIKKSLWEELEKDPKTKR